MNHIQHSSTGSSTQPYGIVVGGQHASMNCHQQMAGMTNHQQMASMNVQQQMDSYQGVVNTAGSEAVVTAFPQVLFVTPVSAPMQGGMQQVSPQMQQMAGPMGSMQ